MTNTLAPMRRTPHSRRQLSRRTDRRLSRRPRSTTRRSAGGSSGRWSVALAVVVSAVASLNIALPDLARTTDASQTQLQWIVDAYSVVFAGLLLPAGALGDRFGRKRTLIAGLVVFGAAYALARGGDRPELPDRLPGGCRCRRQHW